VRERVALSLYVVREIEEVSYRAWPPLHAETVDGWVHRAAGGVTGRANSVWPRATGTLAVDDKLARAEAFYAGHDLPLVLQLSVASEPAGLPDLLADRAYYVRAAPRAVQLAHLDVVAAVGDAGAVRVSPAADEQWFAVVAAVNRSFGAHGTTARALLAGVTQPSAYAVLTLDGAPAAAGRAVVDGRWLGIFNMATLPAFRRRGAARAVLAALAEWGAAGGATTAYLQMEADNGAAPGLYDRAGFTTCYEYEYWSRSALRR
jgi:ribosomal protein S18 acetylase RimI-like enzyme